MLLNIASPLSAFSGLPQSTTAHRKRTEEGERERGRRKEDRGRRKEDRGRRKEDRGRRKGNRGRRKRTRKEERGQKKEERGQRKEERRQTVAQVTVPGTGRTAQGCLNYSRLKAAC